MSVRAGILVILVSATIQAPMAIAQAWTTETLAAALERRSAVDRSRDEARQPAAVVGFSGVEPGMTVVDLMAAGGWYTEVFSVAVGPEGKVYAQNPTWMLEARGGASGKALGERLTGDRLANVLRADGDLGEVDIPAGSVDVAFTALNFHDVYYRSGEDVAAAELEQIHALLKPGGVLVIVDHSGNPALDNASLHRIPQQIAVDLASAAGFELEAEGQMLKHADDDLTAMVFARELRGSTDRFVLKFRKPG